MLTPAISASSTSPPRVMRPKASSTQVRGPPLRYLCPLADEITTGLTDVITAGACEKADAAPAATTPAAPEATNSRRLTLCAITLLSARRCAAPSSIGKDGEAGVAVAHGGAPAA